jgi:hypothetical protein
METALVRPRLGEPVVFQPAVAGGRVYVPTSSGSLFCLETGDAQDDGWYMWGANAAHNGFAKQGRCGEPRHRTPGLDAAEVLATRYAIAPGLERKELGVQAPWRL